jgi:hypothetical protein
MSLGSAGGFFTLTELDEQLSSLHSDYPDLVSNPIEIGRSREGRPILAFSVTAAESTDGIPAMLYTGLIHAREPIGLMGAVYSMRTLADGYARDNEIRRLLESRVLWFVPVANPDGYSWNLEHYPDGGGLWRKNSPNTGRSPVDLNRNFGPERNWTENAAPLSLDSTSESYRGPYPFSEPEAQALRDFVVEHGIRIGLNVHAFGNMLIDMREPDVADEMPTAWFDDASAALADQNGYAPGRAREAVGYEAAGSIDRWMALTERTDGRPRFSWAPEVGSEQDGFWPAPPRISELCEEIWSVVLVAAHLSGDYVVARNCFTGRFGGDVVVRGDLENLGVDSVRSATVALREDGSDELHLLELAPGESRTFALPVVSSFPSGQARDTVEILAVTDNTATGTTVAPLVPSRDTLFVETFSHDLSKWTNDLWGIQSLEDERRVLADSPYDSTVSTSIPNAIRTAVPVALTDHDAATLSFDFKGEVNGLGHHVDVEVRPADQRTWHRVDASGLQQLRRNAQAQRSFIRGGHHTWRHVEVNLDQYGGQEIFVRFTMAAPHIESPILLDGIYVDNVIVEAAHVERSDVAPERDSSRDTDDGPALRYDPTIARLQARSRSPFDLQVFNVAGQSVYRGDGEGALNIDTSGWAPALYLVEIRTGDRLLRRAIPIVR